MDNQPLDNGSVNPDASPEPVQEHPEIGLPQPETEEQINPVAQPEPEPVQPATGTQIYQPEEHEGGIIVGKHPVGNDQEVAVGDKSFIVTFLLSLFLGVFGADRFYLEEVGMGLFKLLTAGGLGVWYVIDLISILTDRKKDSKGSSLRGYHKHLPTAISIVGAWILLWIVFAVFDVIVIHNHAGEISPGINANCSTVCQKGNQPAITTSFITPYGQSASGNGDASGWQVKINVNQHPKTTGEPANPGTHYMSVVFTITNNSGKSALVPGSFYYQTYTDSLLNDTSVQGNESTIVFKNVRLANTNLSQLKALRLAPGQTDNSHYLIFDVPNNDNGKIIWFDGTYNTSSAELAIFAI